MALRGDGALGDRTFGMRNVFHRRGRVDVGGRDTVDAHPQPVADALGTELDAVRCTATYAQTTEDLVLPGDWTIAAGCVAGIDVRWTGILAGHEVIEIRGVWTKGQALEPAWDTAFGYTVTVEGRPTIKSTLSFEPPPDFTAETLDDFIMLGLTITAMPAITAIPAVVAAAPGIATYTDLPLLLPRGVLTTH